jgi:hypothetical protein
MGKVRQPATGRPIPPHPDFALTLGCFKYQQSDTIRE